MPEAEPVREPDHLVIPAHAVSDDWHEQPTRRDDTVTDGQKPRRRWGRYALLTVLVLIGAAYVAGYFLTGSRMPANATIGGVDVSGKTPAAARAAVDAALSPHAEPRDRADARQEGVHDQAVRRRAGARRRALRRAGRRRPQLGSARHGRPVLRRARRRHPRSTSTTAALRQRDRRDRRVGQQRGRRGADHLPRRHARGPRAQAGPDRAARRRRGGDPRGLPRQRRPRSRCRPSTSSPRSTPTGLADGHDDDRRAGRQRPGDAGRRRQVRRRCRSAPTRRPCRSGSRTACWLRTSIPRSSPSR